MEDTALYTLLLGIQPPWRVTRVEVGLAAPGYLPVPDVCACPAAADELSGGWREADPPPVGRGAVAVHAGLRAPADRHAHGVRCDGGESPHGDELGRGVGGPGAGRRPRARTEGQAGARPTRDRREGGRQGASLRDARV